MRSESAISSPVRLSLWSRVGAVLLCVSVLLSSVQAQSGEQSFQLSDRVSAEIPKLQPLLDAQNWNGAIALINSLLTQAAPNSYDQAVLSDILGKIYLQKGDYAPAIAPMETALRLSDAHGYLKGRGADALVDFLSKLYYAEGTAAKSLDIQRQYLQRATTYVQRLINSEGGLTVDNQLFYTTLLYTRAVLDANNLDTALLKQTISEAEKALLMSARPRENFYQILISSLQQLNDYKRSADYYEILVKLYPSNRTYWQQLAAIYTTLAQETKDEREAYAYNLRSILTMERAQALGFLNTPRDNFNLVGVYFNINQFGKATEILHKGLNDKTIESTQRNWELLAYSYQQVNRENQAVEVLLEATKLFPESGQLEFQLGQIYYSLERYDPAYRHFRLAVEKGSLERPLAVYSFLGYLCYEQEKYEEGIKILKQALELPGAEADQQLPRLLQAMEDALAARETTPSSGS